MYNVCESGLTIMDAADEVSPATEKVDVWESD
jgi:hypothetical protein